jgi:hypothetical protein
MSLIRDIEADFRRLDFSPAALRRFGLSVGGLLVLYASISLYLHAEIRPLPAILGSVGFLLALAGLIARSILSRPYRYWMVLGLLLGWFVSRVILLLLFYIVFTPIAILARSFGANSLDIRFKDGKATYWVHRRKGQADYSKMF